jgi:hypothetical protein
MALIIDQPLEARPRSKTRDHADCGSSVVVCCHADDLEILANHGTKLSCVERPLTPTLPILLSQERTASTPSTQGLLPWHRVAFYDGQDSQLPASAPLRHRMASQRNGGWLVATGYHSAWKGSPLMMRTEPCSCFCPGSSRSHASASERVVSGRPVRFPTFQEGVRDAGVWAEAGEGASSGKPLTFHHVASVSPSLRPMRSRVPSSLDATALKTKRNADNLTLATSVSPGRTLGR